MHCTAKQHVAWVGGVLMTILVTAQWKPFFFFCTCAMSQTFHKYSHRATILYQKSRFINKNKNIVKIIMCVCLFVSGNETVFLIFFFFFKKVPRLTLVVDLFVLDKSCVFFSFTQFIFTTLKKWCFSHYYIHTYIHMCKCSSVHI